MGSLKKCLTVIFMGCSGFILQAQNSLLISFSPDSLQVEVRNQVLELKGAVSDSSELQNRITAAKVILYSNSYLFSRAKLTRQDSAWLLSINPGRPVYAGKLSLNQPTDFALPVQPEQERFNGSVDSTQFRKLVEYYLTYLEDHGYPFASISTKNFDLVNDSVHLNLKVEPGPLVTFDSVIVKGFDRFPRNALKYDFGFRKGKIYNESYLRNLPNAANQIEYLNMTRPPAVAFTKSKTILYLYLEEVKSNHIDGVVGLNTKENGDVVFTGDIQLRLLHVLKKGEDISIRWRRPDESVQRFNIDFEIPYLINTPFWLEGNLGIFRQDSSFVNTNAQGLLKYLIESGSFVSGGINYHASNVLLEESVASTFRSFNTTTYKLGLELRKTNRVIVPTKGLQLKAYGLTGQRQSQGNNQRQYGWQVMAKQFISVFPRHILKVGLQSEALFGGQLFTNEQYRIGGLKTLRGFNEQSIYASRYGIGTFEYRFMIGTYDYLTLFSDIGYVENNAGEIFTSTLFTGIGTGINFRTNAGIFSLFYALGKDDQSPFELRTSKIHFGYINRF